MINCDSPAALYNEPKHTYTHQITMKEKGSGLIHHFDHFQHYIPKLGFQQAYHKIGVNFQTCGRVFVFFSFSSLMVYYIYIYIYIYLSL